MKSIKISIIIIGRICSGKTTYSKEIAKFLDIRTKSFGAYLKYYCELNGIAVNRENLQKIGEEYIKTQPKIFLEKVLSFEDDGSDIIIIEGVRHKIIFDELLQLSENIFPIFIDADQQTRYQRYINRNKESDIIVSLKQFLAIDNHPVEMEIESLKSKCSLIIDSVDQPINIAMESIKDFLNKYLR
jgi:cytidylate kinase